MPALLRFLVILVFAVAACGERPRLERLPSDAVVLAFGDSLTFGTGAAESESYPAQLEKLIGRRVVRAGVPGEVTAQALARLPEALDAHAPRLVLLCIGGNDFLRRLGNRQAEDNVRAMVNLAKGRGVDVLLIGYARARLPGQSAGLLCRDRQGVPPAVRGKRDHRGAEGRKPQVGPHPPQRARLPRHRRAPRRDAEKKRSALSRSMSSGRSTSHTVRSARHLYRSKVSASTVAA
jgi:hypothetical protein